MFRFKILAALCLCGCAEEKRTDTSPGDVREEAQFHDAGYLYFAESLDWLANCQETSIPKFKKLWTGIDAIWDNPYFVITKVCIILENGWKIQHRPWDDFLQ